MSNQASGGTWDPVWEQIFASRPWGKYPPEAIVRAVFINFGKMTPRDGVRILDFGCGPGANTWFMAREGFRVSGIDASPTALRLTRDRLAAEGLDAELKHGDFTLGLPWPDGHFDGVIDSSALCCNPLPAIRRCVSEIHRVLRPGGTLISMSFTDRTWGYGLGRRVDEPGSFTDIDEGPFAGKGFQHVFGRADLEWEFRVFPHRNVERTLYTLDDCAKEVEWWVLTARK